ncbi:hypothetical protein FH972_010468 [Carpinus fangiana]|uniref:Leucine-rich repeat-containing N-terminal plant-type domain-containing protein n=1 Tax=Carpinus fangiana TaxID=176857 RepID=A0A660KR65_9ROSI|nr:hypothetical protein FH972_010468 [Carpinus fangiana]
MRIPFFSWLFLVPICTLFLNFSTIFVVSHQCLDNQQFLLVELENSLIFNSALSTKLAKWNQSVDCCSWDGVTYNEGCVTGLDLSSEYILGGLNNSSNLFSLQHLQNLSLADNNFNNSQISTKFDKMANLSYLNLSQANFVEHIPIAILRFTRSLPPSVGLASCMLKAFPDFLRNQQVSLEFLDLSNNQIYGEIPASISETLATTYFSSLLSNKLNVSIPRSICNVIYLEVLGQIPSTKQFATFSETSYEGNQAECGFPLKSHYTYEETPRLSPPTYERKHRNYRIVIEWNYISAELGFVFGFGIVIGPFMFWKKWRIWYCRHVDDIFFSGSSPNCILEKNIITGVDMEIKG